MSITITEENIITKHHILIVDDDNRILKLLKKFLEQNGFLVTISDSASEAMKMMQEFIFDLIILDVMMPEISGLEFAKNLRSQNVLMPIVMLTALSEPEDRITGLEHGANDYMSKPFEPRELLLRINNLLTKSTERKLERDIVRFGTSIYNKKTKELTKNGSNICLSFTETKLLDLLVNANSSPLSREELAKIMGCPNPRSIDVQVVRLRNKIEADPKKPIHLQSIRNYGYILYVT